MRRTDTVIVGGGQAGLAMSRCLSDLGIEHVVLEPGGAIDRLAGDGPVLEVTGPDAHTLGSGARVGQYEVVEVIGRGGMGEVYRARDTELARDVALKVLPERFASNPDRVLRFRREAQLLASLNHPGIATIHGVVRGGGVDALVLELVDGPTLSDRLARGALPLDQVLTIARSITGALEAAHDGGVVHRDLKPANIKVRADGSVKVLDFGIAKALANEDDAGGAKPDLTGASGRVFGTVSYMSPEQVRAQRVDQRADIWAYGCVLFEMLTGARAFAGDSSADIVARVLEREPAFGLLPAATPAPIRRLLRRCLQKDPKRRLGYIGDAMLELDDAATASVLEPTAEPALPGSSRWWIAGIVAAVVLGAGLATWASRAGAPPEPDVLRFQVPFPAGHRPVPTFQPLVALSPDGRTLVFKANSGGVSRLFRRTLEDLRAEVVPGSEHATSPFFSPDGRWLGFDADGVLKRVPLDGGPALTICAAPGGVTAAWGPDDTIVFSTNTTRVLMRVPATGGQPAPLTALDQARGETSHLLPQFLPDGRSVLFTIQRGGEREIAVRRLDGGETVTLAAGTHGRAVPGGHLVFWRDETLWATRFDPAAPAVEGEPLAIVTGVADTDRTVIHYAVSPSGALVYLPAFEPGDVSELVWLDRQGLDTPAPVEPGAYDRLALSPDGLRVALSVRGQNTDIWVSDPARGTRSRLTFEPTIETMPLWTPDGSRVVFRSERDRPGIWWRSADGAGDAERLTETSGPIHSPYSWTPDGRTLLLALFHSYGHQEIASVTPPDPTVRVELDGAFAQLDAQVSPDGRWLAYQSDETGRFEIYVRPFPDLRARRWQVSTRGGMAPRWHPHGGELYYYDGAGLTAVAVESNGEFRVGPSRSLFSLDWISTRLGPDYDVAPDGERFLFIRPVRRSPGESPTDLVYVRHFLAELTRRPPASR